MTSKTCQAVETAPDTTVPPTTHTWPHPQAEHESQKLQRWQGACPGSSGSKATSAARCVTALPAHSVPGSLAAIPGAAVPKAVQFTPVLRAARTSSRLDGDPVRPLFTACAAVRSTHGGPSRRRGAAYVRRGRALRRRGPGSVVGTHEGRERSSHFRLQLLNVAHGRRELRAGLFGGVGWGLRAGLVQGDPEPSRRVARGQRRQCGQVFLHHHTRPASAPPQPLRRLRVKRQAWKLRLGGSRLHIGYARDTSRRSGVVSTHGMHGHPAARVHRSATALAATATPAPQHRRFSVQSAAASCVGQIMSTGIPAVDCKSLKNLHTSPNPKYNL